MVAIRQRFRGGLNGTVLLIFPGAKSLELVRTLLGDDMPLETLTELEQETLLDVGNVILNSFLASFTEMMTMEFEFESAEFLRATCRELLDARAHTTGTGGDDRLVQAREQAVLLMMDFRTGDDMPEKVALHGFIVMLFSDEEMLALRRELQQILSRF
jgi:chemotaxis protein CheC